MTRRIAIAGVAAFAVVLLFFLIILKPKFGQISEVRDQIEAERQTTQSLEIRLRQLQAAQRNQVETTARLAALNRALPANPDLPALIRLLQSIATRSGMDLLSIAPSPPAKLDNATGVDVISVNLQLTGGFFRLESFMTRLEDMPRVVEVTSISVAPTTDEATGLISLATTLTFRMYVVQANASVVGAAPSSPRPTTPTSSPAATASPAATTSPNPTPTATGTP
jgi:Tfp pilus assembly protein PilO